MTSELGYEEVVVASIVAGPFILVFTLKLLNYLSYDLMKRKILKRHAWDLNICCGKTDGGGINADIFRHAEVPNFVLIEDIYHLPFADKQFPETLCSHTIEHVKDPERFLQELQRVSEKVVLVLPPLWDISAALNFLEHQHIFLTFRKEHRHLPRYVKLPFAASVQRKLGQRLHA
jgi:hypothetical protein